MSRGDGVGVRLLAQFAPVMVLVILWLAVCWIDIGRRSQVRYLPKWAWAVVCLVAVPLGGIVYFLTGRGEN